MSSKSLSFDEAISLMTSGHEVCDEYGNSIWYIEEKDCFTTGDFFFSIEDMRDFQFYLHD